MHRKSSRKGVVEMLTDTRAMTAEYRLQYWAEIMQRHQESGLNVKMYCAEIGIKEHRYYYWQRRLRVAADKELRKIESDKPGLIPTRSGSSAVWAGVDMRAVNAASNSVLMSGSASNNVKICREGWTVMIEPGVDAETLNEALRAVNRLCY
jgi:hypothetical protein